MKKNKKKLLWQVLSAILIMAAGGAAFHTVHAEVPLTATLNLNSNDITVGDVIPLTLQVTHPAGWRVIIPTLDRQWGDFEVRSQAVPEIITNPDGTQTTIQEIKLARMRPGETETPALALSVANDQGSLNNLEVAPVQISVRSVLAAGDTAMREIKPQAEMVSEGRLYWPLATAGVLCAAVLTGYGIRRWRQFSRVDRRTPRQRALDTLAGLAAQQPQSQVEISARSALLADTLRDYLAATTSLPARDLTTREIANRTQDLEIPPDWSDKVVEVLFICDDVKFANETLEGPHLQAMIATVRHLIELYPPQPQPASRRQGRHKKAEVFA